MLVKTKTAQTANSSRKKVIFALLLNQPFQICIKSLFNQNNYFCVLFITETILLEAAEA